jgi:hypothetical protein
MNDDGRTPRELEDALRTIGRALETAAPTDYPERVLARLAHQAGEEVHRDARTSLAPARGWRGTRVLTAAAAVLVIAIVLTVANPGARRAVASWFGFAGVDIQSSPTVPPAPSRPTGAPGLHAGGEVTLAEAQRASRFRVQEPASLRSPDDVFLRRDAGSVVVTLAYRTAAGLERTSATRYALILTEIYDAGDPILRKILSSGATAVAVRVDEDRGVYLRGPQEIITLDHSRTSHGMSVVHEVAARASANTLIWGHGTTTYRLEADFSQREAILLAESLR